MSMSIPELPKVIVHPPTPLNLSPTRQFEATLSYLPLDFLGSLDDSEVPFSPSTSASSSSSSSSYPPHSPLPYYHLDEHPVDHTLLSPPRIQHRKRRISIRKPQKRQASFVGLSLVGIAAIVLFTSIASISSPLHSLHSLAGFPNEKLGTGVGRAGAVFNRRSDMGLEADVQGRSVWWDMTLSDMFGQRDHQREEQQVPSKRALSSAEWNEYKRKQEEASTATMEFWDFH